MEEQKQGGRTEMWIPINGFVLALALLIAAALAPRAEELSSNPEEANGEIARVWYGQHQAQVFSTGEQEPHYMIDGVELDVVEWADDAVVTVSLHAAEGDEGPGKYLYRLENPKPGPGRKEFTVRPEDRVVFAKHQLHSVVIRNLGEDGSFILNTAGSKTRRDEPGWPLENGRWTANPNEDHGWVRATGVIKMRLNDRVPTGPFSAAPDNIRILEENRHLTISWDEVPEATGYFVQWKMLNHEFGPQRQEYVEGGDHTSVRIHVAEGAGERHKIRVRATNGKKDGPWSENLTARPKMGLLIECTH